MDDNLNLPNSSEDQSKGKILSGVLFGLITGIIVWFLLGWFPGLVLSIVSGILFGHFFGKEIFKFTNKVKNEPGAFPSYKLDNGETVVNEILANHTENNIAVGGKLLLTNTGIRFVAHQLMGNSGSQVYIPYAHLTKVYVKKGSLFGGLFSGGLVNRLAIGSKQLPDQFFVISNPQGLVDYLSQKVVTNSL